MAIHLPCTSAPTRSRRKRGFAVLAAFAAIEAHAAVAAEIARPDRYELSGSATLTVAPRIPQSGAIRIHATLDPVSATDPSTVAQAGGPFRLAASLSTLSLTCYNDTIFRDDFDGDGF